MNITDIDTLVDEFSQHLADVLEDVPPIPTPLAHSIQHQVLVEWLRKTLTTQATTHQATLAEVVGEIRTMLTGIHNHDGNTASTRIAMRKAKALLTDIAAKHSIPLTDDKP